MPSPYLTALQALREHYEALGRLAELGQWDDLKREAGHGPALFRTLHAETARPAEKAEAKTLLEAIQKIDQRVQLLAGAWLKDTAPLLAVLNKSR